MKKKKNNLFKKETGVILGKDRTPLHFVDGFPGYVEFPAPVIWGFHQKQPGIVYALSHVHPPRMSHLSKRDELTLKTWAHALFPFPIRIITITEMSTYSDNTTFKETCYFGLLESKDNWQQRDKNGSRNFEIVKEWEKITYLNLKSPIIPNTTTDFLVGRSYAK